MEFETGKLSVDIDFKRVSAIGSGLVELRLHDIVSTTRYYAREQGALTGSIVNDCSCARSTPYRRSKWEV